MIQIGDEFGRLTVYKINVKPPDGVSYAKKLGKWCKCKCSCKRIITIPEASLLNGSTKSCGCLRAEIARKQLEKNRQNGIKPKNPRALKLTLGDETKTLTEWADEIGITKQALSNRLKRMSVERALTMKAGGNHEN